MTKVKETTAPVLTFYVTKPTQVCTDASRQCLRFVMQQQTAEGQWNLVHISFHCPTNVEYGYAVIELELVVATWTI